MVIAGINFPIVETIIILQIATAALILWKILKQ